jgi:DNA-binding response OmpR family regulator
MTDQFNDEMRILRPVILLLENNTNDVFFFRRALARLGYHGSVRIVTGVSDARSYLEGNGPYRDRSYYPIPDLIVCDMKVFGGTGNQFLEWVRQHDDFRKIPVVMLSGSSLPEERVASMELGARTFLLKTGDMGEMTERVNELLKHLPATDSQARGR